MAKEAKAQPITVEVDREDFLRRLEEVRPGLSPKPILEQTNAFVFRNGKIYTYNEQIACRTPSGLPKEIRGAVPWDKFLEILKRLPESKVTLEFGVGRLTIRGKNKRAWVTLENQVLLNVSAVQIPEEWKPLHEDFTDAVAIVEACAGKDESAFTTVCIHIHPKWMEAFDNAQMVRYKIKTGVTEPYLVRRDGIRHILAYDFSEFGEAGPWIHFRSKSSGTILSCRRYVAEAGGFQDFSPFLNGHGRPMTLPKTLGKDAENAEIFTSENDDNQQKALVEIAKGNLRITGEAIVGGYQAVKKLKYDGPPMKWQITPQLLIEILKRHVDCDVTDKRLLVDGGKFKYAVSLDRAE